MSIGAKEWTMNSKHGCALYVIQFKLLRLKLYSWSFAALFACDTLLIFVTIILPHALYMLYVLRLNYHTAIVRRCLKILLG